MNPIYRYILSDTLENAFYADVDETQNDALKTILKFLVSAFYQEDKDGDSIIGMYPSDWEKFFPEQTTIIKHILEYCSGEFILLLENEEDEE